jgi:hypothetical protein
MPLVPLILDLHIFINRIIHFYSRVEIEKYCFHIDGFSHAWVLTTHDYEKTLNVFFFEDLFWERHVNIQFE